MKKRDGIGLVLIVMLASLLTWLIWKDMSFTDVTHHGDVTPTPVQPSAQTARMLAHGDLLYHDVVYESAKKSDGTYEFLEQFKYVKPWFDQADLVVGDFEGTIHPEVSLAGYPLFNAPKDVTKALQWAGYDVLDLAHNHILDTGLEGLKSTVLHLEQAGITPVGVYAKQSRETAPIVIKDVNGIKIAFLAYAYGFNGLDATLTPSEKTAYLSDLDEGKMKAEIEKAEQLADVTVVMPQMGVEYALQPNADQKRLYRQMVDWGADVVLGNHPHVVQPAERVWHQGDQKLIMYSMGNFLSNQRFETLENYWTERGVLMDVTFEKQANKTIVKSVKAHPSWVSRVPNGRYASEGYALHDYHIYVLEDFIVGGKYRDKIDATIQKRIDEAYEEMNAHVDLQWEES